MPRTDIKEAACDHCGLPYDSEGWADVVIPDAIWNALADSLNVDLLCFTCMTKALVQAGYKYKDVPVVVTSGPYRDANEEWRLIGWEHGRKVGLEEAKTQC